MILGQFQRQLPHFQVHVQANPNSYIIPTKEKPDFENLCRKEGSLFVA
jgi:hypothetical protein